MPDVPKIFPLGDNALTVDFGNEISPDLNDRAISLATQLSDNPFPGFIEAVPAYSSVAVFYDPAVARLAGSTAFRSVADFIRRNLDLTVQRAADATRSIDITVDFSDKAALDMDFLVGHSGRRRDEVIEIFLARTYRVYMLGFLPGFAYMGEVDERIAAPRRPSPRLKVPEGSVGIAGQQTGIYPLESPGGWQIIGRTDVEMFTRRREPSCLLKPGDEVRFICPAAVP
ncbi:MAG TPA: 5-oxoprolinase subunit PxpB [Pyrinomonadaceae bacterium]|nr:5-oxoprolinase subunit PxpB [Pyrinomonadaceae bacterium]